MIKMNFLPILLIKLIFIINYTSSNEILGCGGFIKSHADIDFSKVEIKLLTKQGSLKDKTDCSPSNGYYFLPVYDKGEYLLKISPPPGWSFEPEEVQLNFDGKNDICSQGKDVNFVFKGFGITGKVSLSGFSNGAKDVTVELKSENGTDIRKTVTDINGVFSFTPIIPGKYLITASHSKWHFSKSQYTVIVESGNTELPTDSLVVSGFDVIGKLDSSGQPFGNIGIALFKETGQKLPLYCDKTKLPSGLSLSNAKYEKSASCYVSVSKNGEYVFKAVAPGKYLITPVVENKEFVLHINPNNIEFEVGKDTLVLKKSFEITGFSAFGRVLTKQDGAGIAKATVKLNGKSVTTTNVDGTYTLENIKPGSYALQIEAENLQFDEQNVKVTFSNPKIPDIVVASYKVCGKVVSDKSYVIGITKHGSTFHTTTTSKAQTGDWCTYLPGGKFTAEVLITDTDKASGVQFYPVKQNIDVNSSPVSGISFSQLRATLEGEIKCLPDSSDSCKSAEVSLFSIDSTGKITGQKEVFKARNGKYQFKNILPGPYEINIPQSNLCFDSTTVFININSSFETAPPFIHRGYEVSIVSSHRINLIYTLKTSEENTDPALSETVKLLSGVNTFCIAKAGDYELKTEGCHKYDNAVVPKTLSTYDPNPLTFTATSHKIGVRLLSTDPDLTYFNFLVTNSNFNETVIPRRESQKVDGYYSYRYDTYLQPDELVKITPKSNDLLFKPESRDLVGGDDCVDIAFHFIATKGLIVTARVVPVIEGVKVTMSFPKNPELAPQETMTTASGEFKFRPIDPSVQYELKAEKESYVFGDYDKTRNAFKAHKLCDIIVKVKDEDGSLLSGVLLSLSGAESYRKNLVTGDDGTIKFHSLSPSQYFLRPMMKEYKFEPNSKMIEIKDGETSEVELVGKRVAYSVFGAVTSLNGDAFPLVNIEAISDEKCMHHQEEGTSEKNGQYRIRGLQPGCKYTIRTKDGDNNVNVERSIPPSHTIEVQQGDVKNIDLIAISPIQVVDVAARVFASSNEYYKTLRIQMYQKGKSDSPIYSQRVETPLNPKGNFNPGIMVFFPRIPLDGKTYFIELKTTLSDKMYKYILPTVQFVANTSSIFVEVEFKPEVRTAEGDINQNSISALILVALVAIAFFRQDLAMRFLNFLTAHFQILTQKYFQKQQNKRKEVRQNEPINYKEIEQLADGINAIKKKKPKKI